MKADPQAPACTSHEASTAFRLAAVVPALNEEGTIGRVVSSLLQFADRVYVVDDGSADNTGAVAARNGAVVLRNESPRGYDAAIAAGLNRAFEDGALAAVTCDADGQHRPEDVERVARLVTDEGHAVSAGLRDRHNRAVEALVGVASQFLFASRDPFCGLKCYSSTFYRRLGHFPEVLNVGTLPLMWVRKFRMDARFMDISVNQRLDRPRFGGRVSADLRLLRAFAATALAAANPRADPLGRARYDQ